MSVGRFHSAFSRQALPVLDFPSVMVGDHLDLTTAFIEVPKKEAQSEEAPPSHQFVSTSSPIVL